MQCIEGKSSLRIAEDDTSNATEAVDTNLEEKSQNGWTTGEGRREGLSGLTLTTIVD
jgi:hypothetical protein